MKKFLILFLVLAGMVAAFLGLRRPAPMAPVAPAAADCVLPDRKVFDAWQGGMKVDTNTDYRSGRTTTTEPKRR